MKMIHHHDSVLFKKQSVNRWIVIVSFLFLCTLVLLYRPVRGIFSEALYFVAPSMWRVNIEAKDATDGFWANFKIKRSLEYENSILHEDITRMQAQMLDRNLLKERVLKLEDTLGREGSDNRVFANVLSGPGRSLYDVLIIDVGVENGIAVGDLVVYAGSGAIGEISEVYNSSAKVKLYSSPNEEHLVLVGPKAVSVVAYGRGMGNFETKLPKGSTVTIGDIVVVPQDNLVLGIVGLVDEKPTLPFVNVFFRTTFNIAEIRSVEVIKR